MRRPSVEISRLAGLLTVACVSAAGGVAAHAADPEPPPNPFANVPLLMVSGDGYGMIRAKVLGGSWTTPTGALVSTTPPCCVRSGRRQTLYLRPGASVVLVLRESVPRVRVYTATGRRAGSRFFAVTRDPGDPVRWQVRAPRLGRGLRSEINVEVAYSRGTMFYRFAAARRD